MNNLILTIEIIKITSKRINSKQVIVIAIIIQIIMIIIEVIKKKFTSI